MNQTCISSAPPSPYLPPLSLLSPFPLIPLSLLTSFSYPSTSPLTSSHIPLIPISQPSQSLSLPPPSSPSPLIPFSHSKLGFIFSLKKRNYPCSLCCRIIFTHYFFYWILHTDISICIAVGKLWPTCSRESWWWCMYTSSLINLLNQFWVQLVLVVTWCCY